MAIRKKKPHSGKYAGNGAMKQKTRNGSGARRGIVHAAERASEQKSDENLLHSTMALAIWPGPIVVGGCCWPVGPWVRLSPHSSYFMTSKNIVNACTGSLANNNRIQNGRKAAHRQPWKSSTSLSMAALVFSPIHVLLLLYGSYSFECAVFSVGSNVETRFGIVQIVSTSLDTERHWALLYDINCTLLATIHKYCVHVCGQFSVFFLSFFLSASFFLSLFRSFRFIHLFIT